MWEGKIHFYGTSEVFNNYPHTSSIARDASP